MSAGIHDVETISSKYCMLQGVNSVDAMRKMFRGREPSVLLAHPMEETEALQKPVDELVTLLSILGNLDILLYKEAKCVKPTEFLITAMVLQDGLPVMLSEICQMERLVGSTSKGKSNSVWLIRPRHVSRNENRSPLYHMVPLRLPRESSEHITNHLLKWPPKNERKIAGSAWCQYRALNSDP